MMEYFYDKKKNVFVIYQQIYLGEKLCIYFFNPTLKNTVSAFWYYKYFFKKIVYRQLKK